MIIYLYIMTIPKIIHNIWMGKNKIPELHLYCVDTIKKTNPHFDYILWNDESVDELMKTEFTEYYDKFNELPRMIMKIDMIRYFLMYKYGGLYIDMDYLMFKPFDLLDNKVVLPCNKEDVSGNPEALGNCIMASEPKHPFWKSLMDTLFTIDRKSLPYKSKHDVIYSTGPMFVFNMWKKYSTKYNDIYIPKRCLFHPPTQRNKEYIEKVKNEGCYGLHLCSALWLDVNYNL